MAPSGPPTATIAVGEVALPRARRLARCAFRWPQGCDLALGRSRLRLWRPVSGTDTGRSFCRNAAAPARAARRALERDCQAASCLFRTLRALQLADLHGPGLGWFGITSADVAAGYDRQANLVAYETTQAISERAYQETGLDGIQYRSRFDTDELCIALFDRADEAIDLVDEGREIERAWVEQELELRGRYLIDL